MIMEKPLKVCFLIAGFGEGGAQKQCIYLLNELQLREGVEIHLIYFYEGVNFDSLKLDGLVCWKLDQRSFYSPKNIWAIMKVVRRVKPNVLFSWLQSSDVYAYFVRLLSRGRLRWVMAERDSAYPDDWRFRLRSTLGRQADLIIANSSKGVLYWLDKSVSASRVLHLPNILIPRPVGLKGGGEGAPHVIYAGRLEAQKNIVRVAEAFLKLSAALPQVEFSIIGNGSLSSTLDQMLSGSQRIRRLPFQKDIDKYFLLSRIFVNISLHEGMPNTVMENVALDKRVVVSKIDEHVALLGEDYPYFVNDPDDVDEIVAVMRRALEEPHSDVDYAFALDVMSKMAPEVVVGRYVDALSSV